MKQIPVYILLLLLAFQASYGQTTTTTTTTSTSSAGTTTKTETTTAPAAPAPAANPSPSAPAPAVVPQIVIPPPVVPAAQAPAAQAPAPAPAAASVVAAPAPAASSQAAALPAPAVKAAAAPADAGAAQSAARIGTERYTELKIDFAKGIFDPYYIPFDVPFIVRGPIPKEIKRMVLYYYTGDKPPPFPNDVNVVGSVTVTATGATNGTAAPMDVTGLSREGNIAYGGQITADGRVALQGNLLSGDSRERGVLEWRRNYLNTSSSNAQDNFYFIVPPLTAMKNYKFEFRVYREVSASEEADLTATLRPVIVKYFNKLFLSGYTVHNVPDGFLLDSRDKSDLLNESSDAIFNYYKARDIAVDRADINALLKANINTYIQKYFLAAMVDRGARYASYSEKLNQALALVTRVASDPVLTTISRNGATYHLADADVQFLKLVLLSAPDLANATAGLTGTMPLDGNSTSLKLQAAAKLQADLLTKITNLYLFLTKVRDNAEMAHNPPAIGLGQTISLIADYMYALKGTNAELSNFSDVTAQTEGLYQSAPFDFKAVFPLTIAIPGKTTADFVTRGEWYITADLGFSYIGLGTGNVVKPYLGVNFNLFPINRQADYSLLHSILRGKPQNFTKALSVVMGLTVSGFGSNDQYSDLFGNTSLLTGIGLRLTDGIRFTYGRFWAYRKSADPAVPVNHLVWDPYISLSLDWDLRSWLKNFGKTITGFTN